MITLKIVLQATMINGLLYLLSDPYIYVLEIWNFRYSMQLPSVFLPCVAFSIKTIKKMVWDQWSTYPPFLKWRMQCHNHDRFYVLFKDHLCFVLLHFVLCSYVLDLFLLYYSHPLLRLGMFMWLSFKRIKISGRCM